MKKFGRSILFFVIAVLYWIGVMVLGVMVNQQAALIAAIALTIIFSILTLFTKRFRTVGIGVLNLIGAAAWFFLTLKMS
jgi:heme O synthase-like polyprenyltransferase